ncbi:Uncharacterized protein FKW44_006499, partial [Caligus rogercresseyi]
MTTDSTGILKDIKNPSNPALNNDFRTRVPSSKEATNVNLERSQSCSQKGRLVRRPRYYSEGAEEGPKYSLRGAESDDDNKSVGDWVDGPKKEVSKAQEGDEKKGLRKYIDFLIVKEPIFIMMSITVMTMAIGVPHVLFFLPAHARNLGFPSSDGSKLLAICSVTDMIGRILLTIILDANLASKHICYGLAILTTGFSVLVLAVIGNQFWAMALAMSAYGLGSGAWFLMIPLLLADYLGVENIGSSYGMIRLFQSGLTSLDP